MNPQNTASPRPFPSVTGGCFCTQTRYRLLTSPLFCYACHCSDCQKQSGSAFLTLALIETHNLRITSARAPALVTFAAKPGLVTRRAQCAQCRTLLWSHDGRWGDAVADVRVGTLDFPGLMEPDLHAFVGGKVDWVRIPEGARTAEREFEVREVWPQSSLRRLDACMERFARRRGEGGVGVGVGVGGSVAEEAGDVDEGGGEGEKTPTGADGDGDGEGREVEDDEAFERRVRETEKALHERLERLSLKLDGDTHDEAQKAPDPPS